MKICLLQVAATYHTGSMVSQCLTSMTLLAPYASNGVDLGAKLRTVTEAAKTEVHAIVRSVGRGSVSPVSLSERGMRLQL
jgi:hypothetical protein